MTDVSDVQAAISEMHRKPDAHKALELIEQITTDEDVLAVIDAYFDAMEDRC